MIITNKYIILYLYRNIYFLTFSGVGPYDIGLLKLASPLNFTEKVQPVELALSENDPRGEAWFCGWGSTSTSDVPKRPDKLQHVKAIYINRRTCYRAILHLTGSSPIDTTNICTGPLFNQISTCSVSSGHLRNSVNGLLTRWCNMYQILMIFLG